jgi:hypothetical protein
MVGCRSQGKRAADAPRVFCTKGSEGIAEVKSSFTSACKAAGRLFLAGAIATLLPVTLAESAGGCGSRGGPGCRLPNGRCASWREAHRCSAPSKDAAPTKKPSESQQAQQKRMKGCTAKAAAKGLQGDARKAFMSSCLKG